MNLQAYTPVEEHEGIYVKREDLCCDELPLSKIRGAYDYIRRRPEKVIVCMDTWRSLNGLATAIVCQELGRKCIMAYPEYHHKTTVPKQQLLGAEKYGAVLIPITAGRQRIMEALLRRKLGPEASMFGAGYHMMPTAFRIPDTMDAVHLQYYNTIEKMGFRPRVVVVPVGTGTHLRGILRAITTEKVIAVLGYSHDIKIADPRLFIVDEGYNYDAELTEPTPFPASGFYEKKAWRWVKSNPNMLGPILFWNIGAPLP